MKLGLRGLGLGQGLDNNFQSIFNTKISDCVDENQIYGFVFTLILFYGSSMIYLIVAFLYSD